MNKHAWATARYGQFVGVSIAAFAYVGLFFTTNVATTERIAEFGVTIVAISVPYIVGGVGLIWDWKRWPIRVFSETRFTLYFLYIDSICLAVLVFLSGGAAGPVSAALGGSLDSPLQSVFTPLFVVVPAAGAIFIVHMERKYRRNIWYIVALTVVGYYIIYFGAPEVLIIKQGVRIWYDVLVLGVLSATVVYTTWIAVEGKEF